MNFSNSYACLDEVFFEKTRPTPVQDPQLFLWNSSLAEQLMIPNELKHDPIALAQAFSGNYIMPGSEPIATDNTSLCGETIDYGPCAMMGIYDPQTVYSSIDTMGRYAFGNQPKILQWNLARFAECLLPLINADRNRAVDQVGPVIAEFSDRFEKEYMKMMGRKLGLTFIKQEDQKLIVSVLNRLKDKRLDYTATFDLLTKSLMSEAAASQMYNELGECFDLWQKRLREQHAVPQKVQELMRQHNPVVIPRNHHVEEVIQACEQTGKVALAEKFLQVLRSPYEELAQTSEYQDPPSDGDKDYQTFCGT